jgi:polyisoprenoid-binding protein YceI
MRIFTAICAASLLLTFACDNDPVGDAPRAEATDAAPVEAKQQAQETEPEAPAKKSFDVNAQNSSIEFVGAKVTGKHDGKFNKFSGKVDVVGDDPTKSSVMVTIDMKEFETDTEKLTGHLATEDFFHVEKFPEANFTSTKIEKAEKPGEFKVTGNLELHGVTKSISFPAKIDASKDGVSVSAEFGINRKDFEINYPGMKDDLIKDEVLIKLKLDPKQA